MSQLRVCCALCVAATACGRLNFEQVSRAEDSDAGGDAVVSDAAGSSCGLQPSPATGTEYFVGPTGTDVADGRTAQSSWATFAHAWSTLQPGDTLTILDGTYRQTLRPTVSGTVGMPILIRAQHDGAAIVDGESVRAACSISGASSTVRVHDIDLEGVRCINALDTTAGGETTVIINHADRVRARRVTARGINDGVFGVFDTNDVLLEDVAASGGQNLYTLQSSTKAVLRRCYGRWTTGASFYGAAVLVVGSGAVIENCVVDSIPHPSNYVSGYIVTTSSTPSNNNRLFGNVSRAVDSGFHISSSAAGLNVYSEGTTVRDSAAINATYGVYQRADGAVTLERLTLRAQMTAFYVLPDGGMMLPAHLGFTLTNSALSGASRGISHSDPSIAPTDHHDNVFGAVMMPYVGGAVAGANEAMFSPNWDVATYGDGAYLIRPSRLASAGAGGGPAGSEILYRTENGTLTTTPLWPWPLEDRILTEEGVSVTWEARGGLWRTPPPVSCP